MVVGPVPGEPAGNLPLADALVARDTFCSGRAEEDPTADDGPGIIGPTGAGWHALLITVAVAWSLGRRPEEAV